MKTVFRTHFAKTQGGGDLHVQIAYPGAYWFLPPGSFVELPTGIAVTVRSQLFNPAPKDTLGCPAETLIVDLQPQSYSLPAQAIAKFREAGWSLVGGGELPT